MLCKSENSDLQAHEGIEQLKVNLKKEHDLKVDYMTAVWISVSSPSLQAREAGSANRQCLFILCHSSYESSIELPLQLHCIGQLLLMSQRRWPL